MKIEARIEEENGGKYPIIFFLDVANNDKTIQAYTPTDGHISAARGYMRSCKKPETQKEYAEIFDCLAQYFAHASYYANKR